MTTIVSISRFSIFQQLYFYFLTTLLYHACFHLYQKIPSAQYPQPFVFKLIVFKCDTWMTIIVSINSFGILHSYFYFLCYMYFTHKCYETSDCVNECLLHNIYGLFFKCDTWMTVSVSISSLRILDIFLFPHCFSKNVMEFLLLSLKMPSAQCSQPFSSNVTPG